MATLTYRGPYQWQAIVRRTGYPSQTRTFENKRDAQDWAATVESEMRRGLFIDRSEAERTTLGELLVRYRTEVTPMKRGKGPELSRLKRLIAHPIALLRLAQLRAVDFSSYRDERLGVMDDDEGEEDVAAGASGKTVREELLLLSAVLNTARKDWSIPVENYVLHVRKPAPSRARERRLEDGEEEAILAAARDCKNPGLECAIVLAIETGMRRGEMAGLHWPQIDLKANVIRLDKTKNGERRIVPLSERAEAALRAMPRALSGKVFAFHDSDGVGKAFVRACERAGITGLRFHDLRHEAASRFAPRMPAPTLAKLMGWKSIQMAMRYYNPTERELLSLVRAAC